MELMTDPDLTSKKYRLFTVGAIGTFMATLDGSIVNVALPTMATEFGVPVNQVAWVVLSYALTLVSLMMVFGAWAARRGYGFAYKFGYIFFILGSVLCSISSSLWMLLAGRVIQAIGAAMFQAVGPGMVTTIFPENERGKGIGLMVMMVSAGLMTGPPLGGLLLSWWSWHSIFIINIPIGFIGLGLTLKYFRHLPQRSSARKMPLLGTLAISVTLLTGMAAVSLVGDLSFSDPRILGLIAVALLSLAVFIRSESRPEKALVGFDLLKNNQFTGALGAMVTMFISMSGVLILVPFYLERIKHYEPKSVGLFLMVLPISMFILAPLSGRLSDKIGYRALTSLGMASLMFGLFMLGRIEVTSSSNYLLLALAAIGSGVGIFSTPNSSALMGAVGRDQRSVVSGIMGTTRNIGMSFGIALSVALFAWFESGFITVMDKPEAFVAAFHRVAWVAIAVAAMGIFLCLLRKNRTEPNLSVDRNRLNK